MVLSDIPGDGMFLEGICKPSMLSSLDLPGQWHLKHLVMLQGQLHSFACFVPNYLSDYYFPLFLLMWFEPHEQREEMLNASQPCWGGRWLLVKAWKGTLAVITTSGFGTISLFISPKVEEPKYAKLLLK